MKCIVSGCTNRHNEGKFVGELCAPCRTMLETGKITPTTSFLATLARKAAAFDAIRPIVHTYGDHSLG